MNKICKITALCIAAIMLFSSAPTFVSGAADGAGETEKTIGKEIDYSDGAVPYKELSAAELLRQAAGITVTEAEKEYFSAQNVTFRYTDNVPGRSVECENKGDGLLVTASPYTYAASSGETVEWIPKSVTVNGVKKSFEGGIYEAVFEGQSVGADNEILTEYTVTVAVPKPVLTALANAGFEEGKRVTERKNAYDEELFAYELEHDNYEKEYSGYLISKNEYEAYLDALAVYNAEKAVYDAYISAKEKYENDYAAWLSYTEAYEKYVSDLAEFEVKNAAYEKRYAEDPGSYAALDACRESMEVLNSIFISDSEGHIMYNTLKGDTVAQVVSRRDELVEYGVSETDIDDAGQSTERLIAVLTPYCNLSSGKDRFAYYKENFGEIRSQFARLYSALYSLANTALVRMELQKREKLERYYQFVAQLYVISAGLDDETTFSDEWNVRGNRAADVLESVQIVSDRDSSDPEGLNYPESGDLPEKPVRPTEPEKAEKPEYDVPDEAEEPSDPPAVVNEPTEPVKPTSQRPEEPVFTKEQLSLKNEVKNGGLKKRAFGSAQPLTFRTTVKYDPESLNKYTVIFADHDGTVLSEKTYYKGDGVTVPEDPQREEDDEYTYTFTGWDKEITAVSGDTTYKAVYERTEKAPAFIPGDVNGDNAVNNKDVVALFKSVSGGDGVYDKVRDFNEDGAVNNKDVVALFKHVSGN